MVWRSPRSFIVFLQGFSLRRRVALSLAVVRLVLVPVIFLAVYYLFAMASIVDRIVSVDAPVATNAQRASIEMLDARRAEANYFLLHDPDDIARNRQSLLQLEKIIRACRNLQPKEKPTFDALVFHGTPLGFQSSPMTGIKVVSLASEIYRRLAALRLLNESDIPLVL